jgi:two-component system, OmpR family, aerobic respiration control sensor histidine kinase ArcB
VSQPINFIALIEEKEKELRLLQSKNAMLQNLIALYPGHMYWKDTEGRFLGCNNNVARTLGHSSPKDIVGKRNNDLFDAKLAAISDQIDKEVCTLGEEKYHEETGFSSDQQPAIYLTKKVPLFDDQGNIIGILGASFDITERKKMEEDLKIARDKAEASNRAKSQFLAIVNHELRTPLASILGLVGFLRQDKLPENEEKTIIAAIQNCARHLLSLVNDVLDFSSLETGKYHLHIDRINLNEVIYDVHSMLEAEAKNKGLELRIETEPALSKAVFTDSRILRQILINLVGNAIKFTEKGHVTIQVHEVQSADTKTQLAITVLDTGRGIPSDMLNAIFEPFRQLDDAYTRQSSRNGTGLGLTIVEKLAALLDLKIHVVSEQGLGSAFSLTEFETEDADLPPLSSPIKKKVRKKKRKNTIISGTIYPDLLAKKPTVLLVEDDPIVLYVHKKMLTDLGCEVEAVTHGQEAITRLNHHDIVFVDISLPDINGFDVIKAIRARQTNRKVPIVALTVYSGNEEKLACLNAGADEFANKPISQIRLKKLLLRHLSRGQN